MSSLRSNLIFLAALIGLASALFAQQAQTPAPSTEVESPEIDRSTPVTPHDERRTLGTVKSIFVMPMKNRLEHFLTNEIVRWGRFEVTVNPHQADALLSDTTEVDIKELMSRDAKIRKTPARTRGTAFLIDLKTEKVLWSAAKKPATSFFLGGEKSTPELAHEIIAQMRRDLENQIKQGQ
jgi:hypothetical protein